MSDFENMFKPNSKALKMGLVLRDTVHQSFQNIEEAIGGGAKVKLALYSRGDKKKCALRNSKRSRRLLYALCTSCGIHKS